MRNNTLIEASLHAVMTHPERHDQTWYFRMGECGTVMCYAGWTCHLAGYDPAWQGTTLAHKVRAAGLPAAYNAFTVARDLLGLTQAEATTLFAPCNTTEMLQQMVKDLVNGDELQDLDHYMYPADPAKIWEMS